MLVMSWHVIVSHMTIYMCYITLVMSCDVIISHVTKSALSCDLILMSGDLDGIPLSGLLPLRGPRDSGD